MSLHRASRGADLGKCVQTTQAGCSPWPGSKRVGKAQTNCVRFVTAKAAPGTTDCTKGQGAPTASTGPSQPIPRAPGVSHTLQHKPHCLTRQLLSLLCFTPKERRLPWLARLAVPQDTLEKPPSPIPQHTYPTCSLRHVCSHVCTQTHTHNSIHMCTLLPDNHLQREQLEMSVLSMSTFSRAIARWHLCCFRGRALQQQKALCPPPSYHLPRMDCQRPGLSLQTRNQARTGQKDTHTTTVDAGWRRR